LQEINRKNGLNFKDKIKQKFRLWLLCSYLGMGSDRLLLVIKESAVANNCRMSFDHASIGGENPRTSELPIFQHSDAEKDSIT